MGIKIIKADLTNAHEVAYIHVNSWKAAYKGIVPDEYLDNLSVEKKEARFKINYEKGSTDWYLMYLEKKAIGVLLFTKSYDEDADDKTADIGIIYFLPEYWGSGYGSQLLNFGTQKIKDTGYEKITLWVFEENLKARRFYEKNGFLKDGERKDHKAGKSLIVVRYFKNIKGEV